MRVDTLGTHGCIAQFASMPLPLVYAVTTGSIMTHSALVTRKTSLTALFDPCTTIELPLILNWVKMSETKDANRKLVGTLVSIQFLLEFCNLCSPLQLLMFLTLALLEHKLSPPLLQPNPLLSLKLQSLLLHAQIKIARFLFHPLREALETGRNCRDLGLKRGCQLVQLLTV